MNEDTTPDSQAAPDSPEPSTPSSPPPPAAARAGLPGWLPYALLAVIPAVLVGILVFVFAGDGGNGSDDNAAGIVEGLLRLTPDSNTQVDSYKGELPPDLPTDIPMYEGAEPVVSFEIATPGGTNYFIILTTEDSAEEVFSYFQTVLDADPWQLEIGQTGSQVTGIQFTRPDNADVSGVITVHHSELDDVTSILLTYEDLSAALTPGTAPSAALLGQSQPLPPGFPETVPIYGDSAETVVIDSYFQRGQGGRLFAVTFLTQDSPDDVVAFYRGEFEAQQWTVADSTDTDTTSFAIGIEFDDGQERLSGQLTADTYEEDAAYTRVDLVVQVSGAATGN